MPKKQEGSYSTNDVLLEEDFTRCQFQPSKLCEINGHDALLAALSDPTLRLRVSDKSPANLTT